MYIYKTNANNAALLLSPYHLFYSHEAPNKNVSCNLHKKQFGFVRLPLFHYYFVHYLQISNHYHCTFGCPSNKVVHSFSLEIATFCIYPIMQKVHSTNRL
ncbi:unnamed protein product [Orchesella dallaii]|uniref:Uncharacterized protein n=1 Tax=Orchesella dallaii TaxID=48710 RepID=A0ABP1QG47_9HEXA